MGAFSRMNISISDEIHSNPGIVQSTGWFSRKNVLMRPNASLKNRLKILKTFEPVLSCFAHFLIPPDYFARKFYSGPG